MWSYKLVVRALAVVGTVFAVAAPAALGATDGKELFLKKRCQSCHTLEAAEISLDEEAADEADGDDEIEPPDLSATGLHFERESLMQYLLKKERREGRLHKKRFIGKKTDLEILVEWLLTMKEDPQEP